MKSKGDTQGRQVSIHCKLVLSVKQGSMYDVGLVRYLQHFDVRRRKAKREVFKKLDSEKKQEGGKRELAATIREARQRDHSE